MKEQPTERALVILVPEAERLVEPYRTQHDPSAADGMPAHITINYPFSPAAPDYMIRLEEIFAGQKQFSFSLPAIGRFQNVVYLAPERNEPFRSLIGAVSSEFPESQPYGGVYSDVVPHLTVAQVKDKGRIADIHVLFATTAESFLPIRTVADGVALMEKINGRWQQKHVFPLAN